MLTQNLLHSQKLIIFGLFGGVFILFSILSFILYSIHRTPVYLVVGVYTLSLLLYTLSLQGVLYNLDFGINLKLLTAIAWLTPSFTSILFLIYTYLFFSIKERYKKFYYVMVGLISLHTFVILLMSYALFVDPTYTKYSFLTGLSIMFNTIYLLSAGIYMREVGSKFYLIGQLILICAVVLSTLSIYGLITYYDIYRHLVTTALFIDIILLLIAQSLKTKHHVNLLNNSKIALLEHSRYSSIGLAINNITHQWKHPLSHIGLSILMIESLLKNKKESLIPTIETELPKISYSLNLMKKTIDEFSAYYSQDITKNDFSPKNTIEHVIYILNSKILIKNAQFTLEIEDTLIMHNYEHIFSNIIMILIDNSLDEFKIESEDNKISISLTQDTLLKKYILTFSDNAGGIKIKPIEKVFDYFSTSKEDKLNHGAGLAMAKMLIEERLYGDIFLKNKNDGVEFKIFIPQENN
ncbi:MAG: hypothetical protein GW906_08290 [Epsilonproteobacteria bacterium]|nr:hypothetical protein [Campylobacterota bacterium]PIP11428.1 MAG: hypothetical protein COX50_00460 [Sulfurimonas sp. CG23_combo_of_CG06-09_8_20_14_all_36_33]PIS25141.1 MAG: hypothetical protein COT46_06825 [Sulfurimonas sp. CG08_land_8_20_14_0_20_36_33]PIU36158.1 MAG: hypothetical protein COT05_00215 [Sulfurimonas sp. CG07_land_8_20_14_0_80_36_56]PIV04689.1 MAG: hypothetical protein COS56_03885 [Sulfurimonas sp. CG03_land_8_20_14_0_80_36_25]PIV35598.1 MAG: hypothetical protein COS32_05550 [S